MLTALIDYNVIVLKDRRELRVNIRAIGWKPNRPLAAYKLVSVYINQLYQQTMIGTLIVAAAPNAYRNTKPTNRGWKLLCADTIEGARNRELATGGIHTRMICHQHLLDFHRKLPSDCIGHRTAF